MLSTCLLHIFLYIFFINIGCATLYHLSMIYVTVYNMSFNSNCCILAEELNYRFTIFFDVDSNFQIYSLLVFGGLFASDGSIPIFFLITIQFQCLQFFRFPICFWFFLTHSLPMTLVVKYVHLTWLWIKMNRLAGYKKIVSFGSIAGL